MIKSILILFVITTVWLPRRSGIVFVESPAAIDCKMLQRNFVEKSLIIEWDNDTTRQLVDSSFYNKYLSGLEEFKPKKKQVLYYHSVPDIHTEMCLVVIMSIVTDENQVLTQFQNEYTYYLVDVTLVPKVIMELARFEESVDSRRRMYSEFVDDNTLIHTEIREGIGFSPDIANDSYEVRQDSIVFWYEIEELTFKSVKGLGWTDFRKKRYGPF